MSSTFLLKKTYQKKKKTYLSYLDERIESGGGYMLFPPAHLVFIYSAVDKIWWASSS